VTAFLCLLQRTGSVLPEHSVNVHFRRFGSECDWKTESVRRSLFAAIVARSSDDDGRVVLARCGDRIAVGSVRIDGAKKASRSCDGSVATSDVGSLLSDGDSRSVERRRAPLDGDFGFVIWNEESRELSAERDPFGVKTLFYSERGDTLLFASHASLLADGERYDKEYLNSFLCGDYDRSDRTVYAGVRSVEAGTRVTVSNGRLRVERTWDPSAIRGESRIELPDAVARFRDLFEASITQRVSDTTWSMLSGGLDSSSVVSVAQLLIRQGRIRKDLAGTVTYVDSMAAGDERPFSDAVAKQWRLRNETVVDIWPWYDDGDHPPLTDQPSLMYPYYARDRMLVDHVRRAGGAVLLSGYGADNYLDGPQYFLADLLVRGRLIRTATEVARWSVALRKSFWRIAARQMVYPLLSKKWRYRHSSRGRRPPKWLGTDVRARYAERSASRDVEQTDGSVGRKFISAMCFGIHSIPQFIDRGVFEDGIEMRYPFLSRPLVEFVLSLPYSLIVRPYENKYVLREAMRGILPEVVRTRTGKGSIGARVRWSLSHERKRVDALLNDSLLASLGCMDVSALRHSIERVRSGSSRSVVPVFCALSLETWLRVRASHWSTVGSNQIVSGA
jgi:asparagine synthase (glutamine-hydrolysing)